jgi:N-acetylmuramoyl-L-alanine amidase
MTGGRSGRLRATTIALVGGAAVLVVLTVVTVLLPGTTHDPAPTGRVASAPVARRSTFTTTPVAPLDPAAFPPDACVAFPPLAGNTHRTVFLDPGHGGPDPGAVGTTSAGATIEEKRLTLPVALAATQLLRQAGYRVVLSRTTDTPVAKLGSADVHQGIETVPGKHKDTLARAHCANLAGASALVSVHFDAFTSPSARGATTLYDTARSFSAQNKKLASLLQSDIVAAFTGHGWSVPDRGIVSDAGQDSGPALSAAAHSYGRVLLLGPASPGYVDEPSSMPGALVEPLFITAPAEGSIADSAAGQQTIATGIARAIETYLGQ